MKYLLTSLTLITLLFLVGCSGGGPNSPAGTSTPPATASAPDTPTATLGSTPTPEETPLLTGGPQGKVQGSVTREGKTLQVVDGVAMHDVNFKRTEIFLLLVDKPIPDAVYAKMQKTAEKWGDSSVRQKLVDWADTNGVERVQLTISFDPKMPPYELASARWWSLDAHWSRAPITRSVSKNGQKEVLKAIPKFAVDKPGKTFMMTGKFEDWDLTVDVPMLVVHPDKG